MYKYLLSVFLNYLLTGALSFLNVSDICAESSHLKPIDEEQAKNNPCAVIKYEEKKNIMTLKRESLLIRKMRVASAVVKKFT